MPEKSLPKDVFETNDDVDLGLLQENSEFRERLKRAGIETESSYRLTPPLGGSQLPRPSEEGDNRRAATAAGISIRDLKTNWERRPDLLK